MEKCEIGQPPLLHNDSCRLIHDAFVLMKSFSSGSWDSAFIEQNTSKCTSWVNQILVCSCANASLASNLRYTTVMMNTDVFRRKSNSRRKMYAHEFIIIELMKWIKSCWITALARKTPANMLKATSCNEIKAFSSLLWGKRTRWKFGYSYRSIMAKAIRKWSVSHQHLVVFAFFMRR